MNFFKYRPTDASTFALAPAVKTAIPNGQIEFDTAAVIGAGQAYYEVPAGHDGLFADFEAYSLVSPSDDHNVGIQRSTDGGSNWEDVARRICNEGYYMTVSTGPIALATGDRYRGFIAAPGSETAYFHSSVSGRIFSASEVDAVFRLTKASDQGFLGSQDIEVLFPAPDFDPENVITSGRYVVPAGHDGKRAKFTAGAAFSSQLSWSLKIMRSQDGGSNWELIGYEYLTGDFAKSSAGALNVPLVAGDQFAFFVNGNADTLLAEADTFFAGEIYTL